MPRPICEHCDSKPASRILYRHAMINVETGEDLQAGTAGDRVCGRCALMAIRRGDADDSARYRTGR